MLIMTSPTSTNVRSSDNLAFITAPNSRLSGSYNSLWVVYIKSILGYYPDRNLLILQSLYNKTKQRASGFRILPIHTVTAQLPGWAHFLVS